MRVRTQKQFVRELGDEYSWRSKELLDYRLLTRTSNLISRKTLLRAGVPLVYAHWEGFVKTGTELLLNFVCNQALLNKDLADAYFAQSVKTHIAKLIESSKQQMVRDAALFVRDSGPEKAEIRHKNYVNTESNLSSSVFEEIASSIGVATDPYKSYYPYIDASVVDRRNKIAHGEYLQLDSDEFNILVDRVSGLMAMYKTDLENIVLLQGFRASVPVAHI